ncbi:MAG: phage major capsid protein [Pikeienuella sp.]
MDRAFATLEIKGLDEDSGTITGIASTPSPDRMDDVVVPEGAVFKLPIPLLWQHNHGDPIGEVTQATVTDKGIEVVAKIAIGVTDEIDRYFKLIKSGLVRGLSIGFRGLDVEEIKGSYGVEFKKWEWLELSAVTIPANADASIATVKEYASKPAATGTGDDADSANGATLPGVTGKSTKPISLTPKEGRKMKTLAEQIAAFEAKRAASVARMDEIQNSAVERGESKTAEEKEEFQTLKSEVGEIDSELVDLRDLEKTKAASAKPITGTTGKSSGENRSRGPIILEKGDKDEDFEGQNYTRMVIAKTLARLDDVSAVGVAQKRWGRNNPNLVESIKAAVAGGGSDSGEWGAELVHIDRYTGDFIEYLYSRTIFDQLPLREVPANVNIAGQDGAASGYWVGQSKSIPVTKADFFDVNLAPLKVAALAIVSKELLRDSAPSAERLVRDSLVEASAQRVDTTFLSASAAVAGVSPAGILNGLTAGTATGADIDGVIADVKALYAPFIAANNADGLQFVTTQSLSKSLGLMQHALGNFAFPGLNANGGMLLGDNLVAGGNVGAGDLILLKPSDIYKIGDRGVEVSMSQDASIQMDDAPDGASDTPTANTSVVSMYQTESVAIKVVRPLNFAKRRSSAVAYIGDAAYGG